MNSSMLSASVGTLRDSTEHPGESAARQGEACGGLTQRRKDLS